MLDEPAHPRRDGPQFGFDRRTRTVTDAVDVDADEFHRVTVPALLEHHGAVAARAMEVAPIDGLVIAVGESVHTWRLGDGELMVVPGDDERFPRADLDPVWFSHLVTDVRSAVAVMIADLSVMVRGNIAHLIAWDTVLRAVVDGRPTHDGDVDLVDLDGSPLDLARVFRLDDEADAARHFLASAGFVHLRGVFDASEMADLDVEIDHWRSLMTPEDPRAWYARVGDEQVCVRVTNMALDAHEFPFAERLGPVAALAGGEHRYRGSDLLVKPVGVVEGISDLPWHRDCELGMHSYRCTSLTVGVAVTPAAPDNGQLGVVAGSHRINVSMFDLGRLALPVVHPTTQVGDVTVHLSCTLHCATPPVHSERRVTYSSFALPGDTGELDRLVKETRDQAGRDTYAPS